MDLQTEVLIIGGGATGAGISRDLALRGIPSILVEKGDFTTGASGRNQGLLHSGGRYAVNDPEAARECIAENQILRRIAPHCIENTGGLFVSLPEDGAEYRATFIRACEVAGIETLPLSPRETLSMEPRLNPCTIGAVQVPDGAIDPFTLVVENARDAESRGARFFLHTEVTGLIRDGRRITGAKVKDRITGGGVRDCGPLGDQRHRRLGEPDPRFRRPHDRDRPLQGLDADHQHARERAGHQPLPAPRERRHHRPERYGLDPRDDLVALGGPGVLRSHPG